MVTTEAKHNLNPDAVAPRGERSGGGRHIKAEWAAARGRRRRRSMRPLGEALAGLFVLAGVAACSGSGDPAQSGPQGPTVVAGATDSGGNALAGTTGQGLAGGATVSPDENPDQGAAGSGTAGAPAVTAGAGATAAGATSAAGAANLNTEPTVAPDTVVTETSAAVECATLVRPATLLRRLTRFEYDSTVRELLGTALQPAREFPLDEIASGFSNNASVLTVSALHAERYVEASEALAAEAVANLGELLPCDPAAVGETECAQAFAQTFGRRAYRRALVQEDIDQLMAAYAVGDSFEKGIEIMIRAILQSPNFLYRVEFTGAATPGKGMVRLNGYETATRLSYLLWGSGPDDTLLDAAAAGGLDSPESVADAARRLLADERSRPAVAEFYRQWLELTELETLTKDAVAFPTWNDELRSAMIDEGEAFVTEILWGQGATLPELLTAPLGLAAGPLATMYGVQDTGTVVPVAAAERVGILTLPGFLAAQAHPDQTSPVLRGKFVRSKLFCSPPPPPPDEAMIAPPEPTEGQTARVRFSAHSEDEECAGCHALMDPLGFPFESYDSVGAFRTTDGGQPLDLSGEFIATRDLSGTFDGVGEMAAKLADSEQVRDCVASEWFKYAMGRAAEAGDACSLSPLQDAFGASGANLLELMVNTTQTEAFLYRQSTAGEVAQ